MSLKTRLRKLEQLPRPRPWAKRPEDMTEAEQDEEIERLMEEAGKTADGREFLRQLDAAAEGKTGEEAARAQLEFLETDLQESKARK